MKKPERHGGSGTRLYRLWAGMHGRCRYPSYRSYQWYGARGISVCAEWSAFSPFREWALAHGYADNLSLDRIDSAGDYGPENCRWSDTKTQARNRLNNRRIVVAGEPLVLAEAIEKSGLSRYVVKSRLEMGWGPDRALTTPVRARVSEEVIAAIRADWATGMSCPQIGKKYGFSRNYTWAIATRKGVAAKW